MNWQEIKISTDNTHFLYKGKVIFDKKFIEVLKFHAPSIAPVKDETGSYHIDILGNPLYKERFARTFGFYCNRAAVIENDNWFHVTEKGIRAYQKSFNWTGNFQENLCTVRDNQNNYFHIDLNGNRIYEENYLYCGDFKDGYACVKKFNGLYKHIDKNGNYINDKEFLDLDIFHKNFALAKDKNGWFHIGKNGNELYNERYLKAEPFYNGFSLVSKHDEEKAVIDEKGSVKITIGR